MDGVVVVAMVVVVLGVLVIMRPERVRFRCPFLCLEATAGTSSPRSRSSSWTTPSTRPRPRRGA